MGVHGNLTRSSVISTVLLAYNESAFKYPQGPNADGPDKPFALPRRSQEDTPRNATSISTSPWARALTRPL